MQQTSATLILHNLIVDLPCMFLFPPSVCESFKIKFLLQSCKNKCLLISCDVTLGRNLAVNVTTAVSRILLVPVLEAVMSSLFPSLSHLPLVENRYNAIPRVPLPTILFFPRPLPALPFAPPHGFIYCLHVSFDPGRTVAPFR